MLKMTNWIATLAVAASCSMLAQKQTASVAPKTIAAKPGGLSGRVILIASNGDLKPARLATVYLLWNREKPLVIGMTKQEEEEAHNSAAHKWLDEALNVAEELLKRAEEASAEFRRTGRNVPDSVECREGLMTYYRALKDILAWGEAKKKSNQILLTDADEEGNFAVKPLHPGVYTILARGRVGVSDAFWSNDYVVVQAGIETTVKLASPERACPAVAR